MAQITTPAIMVVAQAITVITADHSTAIRSLMTYFTAIRSTATGFMARDSMDLTVAGSTGTNSMAVVSGTADSATGFTAVAEVIVNTQGMTARSRLGAFTRTEGDL
jgi:hypothetical protein